MNKQFNIAIVGATGLVGRTMVKILEERAFPVGNLFLFSSERSAGSEIEFKGEKLNVSELTENSFDGIDLALFSAGKDVSKIFAPIAAKSGTIVIDNGSFWRMHKDVPLIVPEVNPEAAKDHKGIIANPNCSTIQLVAALKPINDRFGLRRIIISTYQSISGAGQSGINQLMSEIKGEKSGKKVTEHQIAFNTVFHNVNDKSGFTEEELKMINEPRKILSLPELKIAVTCVRLPILGGHGESVNIETLNEVDLDELKTLLSNSEGLTIIDDPEREIYPTPVHASNKDDVFIGRIRRDDSVDNGIYLWVVADNIRKGAATNTIQIAELITEKDLFNYNRISF